MHADYNLRLTLIFLLKNLEMFTFQGVSNFLSKVFLALL